MKKTGYIWNIFGRVSDILMAWALWERQSKFKKKNLSFGLEKIGGRWTIHQDRSPGEMQVLEGKARILLGSCQF